MPRNIFQNEYEWLVIFLVYNNNYYDVKFQDTKDYYTMKEQTKYILDQIRYSTYDQRVKTIFVEAQIKNKKINDNEYKALATLSILSKESGPWLSAVDKIWRDGTSVDILTDKNSCETILKKLKDKYPAKKHMIITAGHGSIVGINYYIPGLISNVKDDSDFRENIGIYNIPMGEKKPEELVAETVVNTDTLLYLSNKEINDVLKNVFPDKKLDVLVMYNCLMQNVFTQFELRESVDWLIAPISGISVPGFNYKAILDELNSTPSMDGEAIAQLFINSIRAGNGYSNFKDDIEGTWKVLALKLDKATHELIQNRFADLLSAIENVSIQYGRMPFSCIRETLRYLFNYSYYCLNSIHIIDLGVFLESLKNNINNNYKELNAIIPFISGLQEVIINNSKQYLFEGENFYNNGISHKEDEPDYKKHISNIAIMFPFRKFHSNLLEELFDPQNYKPSLNREFIPEFLSNDKYCQVINKIISRV